MVKRVGRRGNPNRRRRKGTRMQGNLQRVKLGSVRSGRLPADPRPRNMYGSKSGLIEIRVRKAGAEHFNYGSTTSPAIYSSTGTGMTVTNVNVKDFIAAQLLGIAKGDLVSGTLQYSVTNIQAWAAEDRTSLSVRYLAKNALFPKTNMSDISGKLGRARVKMVLPRAVWLNDDDTSGIMFAVSTNADPVSLNGADICIIRVSVQYHVTDTASTPPAKTGTT